MKYFAAIQNFSSHLISGDKWAAKTKMKMYGRRNCNDAEMIIINSESATVFVIVGSYTPVSTNVCQSEML